MLPIQVNGKRRDEIRVGKGEDKAAVEALARSSAVIQAFLAANGLSISKVIVVPDRIVNIVAQ